MNRLTPASSLGIPKSLPDDVLKVGAHGGMRARSGAKEKTRRFSYSPAPAIASRGVPAQRLHGQPGLPQIRWRHGDRRPGQRLCHAVVRA